MTHYYLLTTKLNITHIVRFSCYCCRSGHAVQLAGSQFPKQGLNPGLSSEALVLTTRPPENS